MSNVDSLVEKLSVDLGCARLELDNTVADLASARATLAGLQTRIGELEAERDHNSTLWKQALQKYRKEFERAEAAEQALTAERQRREACEAALRPLDEAFASYGNAERDSLNKMRGCLGLWHFSDAAVYFARFRHADNAPPSTTEAENE